MPLTLVPLTLESLAEMLGETLVSKPEQIDDNLFLTRERLPTFYKKFCDAPKIVWGRDRTALRTRDANGNVLSSMELEESGQKYYCNECLEGCVQSEKIELMDPDTFNIVAYYRCLTPHATSMYGFNTGLKALAKHKPATDSNVQTAGYHYEPESWTKKKLTGFDPKGFDPYIDYTFELEHKTIANLGISGLSQFLFDKTPSALGSYMSYLNDYISKELITKKLFPDGLETYDFETDPIQTTHDAITVNFKLKKNKALDAIPLDFKKETPGRK